MDASGQGPTIKGPPETFTGDVWIDMVTYGRDPSRLRVNLVRFAPGARTAWHSHVLGQTLYVTDGVGLVQARGGPAVEIRAGDVVHAPPDEVHWHGATADHFMAHLSVTEGSGDPAVPDAAWGEHVTDGEYPGHT